jgi:hypothetical protein
MKRISKMRCFDILMNIYLDKKFILIFNYEIYLKPGNHICSEGTCNFETPPEIRV